jgi:ABC-type branched-subunit amino acid transport system ATPase component
MTAAALTLSEVVVDFGGVRALDYVDLAVEPGTIIGLIGANGSGKTTLLDVISGFVTPTRGAVAVDDRDLADDLPEERAAIGVVRSFQDCRLFPELTVLDTLMLTVDARFPIGVVATTLGLPHARRAEAQKRVKVDSVIDTFSLGRFREHRIGELSTGTRRVVDLASIILAEPRLLLLDEPTAGIAQREAEAFIPLLRRMHDVTGATIVLVEHDVPLVFALCSTVVVMQTGSVVAAGPPATVQRDPRALAAYLGASDEAILVSGPHAGPPAGGDGGERGGGGDRGGATPAAAAGSDRSDPSERSGGDAGRDGDGSGVAGSGPEPLP